MIMFLMKSGSSKNIISYRFFDWLLTLNFSPNESGEWGRSILDQGSITLCLFVSGAVKFNVYP